MSDNLPDGWTETIFGNVVKIVGGGTPKSTDLTNFTSEGGTPWITPSDLSGYKQMFISQGARNLTEKGLRESSARLLPSGSVLFSSRAPIGYVAIAANDLTTNQGFKSFVLPDNLDNRFLYFYLKHIKPVAEMMATGTTFKELSGSNAAQLPLLLPPLPEQKRIADKLNALLARVDKCQAHLDAVPALLKQFRRSVLAAAMDGRLLKDEIEIDDDGLPSGWKWITIEDACERIVDCLHSTPKFSENGHYCVDSNWIKPGIFVFEKARFVDTETFLERNRRMTPQAGDVVFSREGALLGVAVYVPENFEICLGQRMMIFRPADVINSKFLEFFLNSQVFRSQYAPLISGTAAPHLNIGDIRTFKIPLPPLPGQHEIVRRVERLFAFAERLEARWRSAQGQVAALTPSLLAKAFRGELV